MRILMVNRENAISNLGGDTIQMLETKKELEKLGVEVDIALGPQQITTYKNYDIIHIFNIQTLSFTYDEVSKVKTIGKPIVLSPVWWNFWKEYFKSKYITVSNKMKIIRLLFGKNISIFLYKIKFDYVNKKKIRKLFEIVDFILPNSYLEFYDIISSFGYIDFNKIRIIYNGVSSEYLTLKNYEIPEDLKNKGIKSKEYALQVGRIDGNKNVLSTILCCKKLNIPLVVIGDKADILYWKKIEKEIDGKNIIYLGFKKNDELIPYYYNAKIHILPSYRETPGLVNLEAASLGCGIVTTRIGSSIEYFGNLAYYCEPNDIHSIEKAILGAWNNPKGNELSKLVREKYTWHLAAKNTLEVYEKIINSK